MRQPSIVVSSVTHDRLAAARLGARDEALDQLVDGSSRAGTSAARRPSPRRTSSIGTDAWFEKIIGTPCAAAARATARSASRCASSSTPIGASSSGAGSRRPKSSTEVALGHVAQHARARSAAARTPRGSRHRALRARAAGDVGERRRRQSAARAAFLQPLGVDWHGGTCSDAHLRDSLAPVGSARAARDGRPPAAPRVDPQAGTHRRRERVKRAA